MAPRKDNNNNSGNNISMNTSGSAGAAAAAAASATAVTSAAEFMSSQDNAAAEQKQALYLANAKLCRLVKRCPWMYDRQHPNYAKKHIVDKSWAKIAKDCGDDSVASCKERWRNIRAAFARSINIYKTTCGPNRVKPYYLYNDLRFLIKPMMDAREMMNKDTDDIKSDWDDSAMATLPPSSTTASTKKLEQDGSTTSISAVAEGKASPLAEPLSDVEADLNFNDEEFELAAKAAETEAELMDVMFETDNEENFQFPENVTTTTHNSKRSVLPVERVQDTHTPNNQKHSTSAQVCHGQSYFSHATSTPYDADAKFLEALLPDMRAMNARQKIIFKRKIYQSLEEVFETNADFPVQNATIKAVAVAATGPPRYQSASRADVNTRCNAYPNLTQNITNLKDREITQLQSFVQNMLVKGTAAAAAPATTGINREQKTSGISRAQNPNQNRNRTQSRGRGAMQTGNSNTGRVTAAESAEAAAVTCNGSDWQEMQPISVKTELIDDDDDADEGKDDGEEDDDDVNDFE